jgi:hypothetical protein
MIAVSLSAEAERIDRTALPNAGDNVLETAPLGKMIEDIPGHDRGQTVRSSHRREGQKARRISGSASKGERHMSVCPEYVAHEATLIMKTIIRTVGDQACNQIVTVG